MSCLSFASAQTRVWWRDRPEKGKQINLTLRVHILNLRECTPATGYRLPDGLLQLRILGFGFLQDGNVGAGVLPKGEEILVGGDRPTREACHLCSVTPSPAGRVGAPILHRAFRVSHSALRVLPAFGDCR